MAAPREKPVKPGMLSSAELDQEIDRCIEAGDEDSQRFHALYREYEKRQGIEPGE